MATIILHSSASGSETSLYLIRVCDKWVIQGNINRGGKTRLSLELQALVNSLLKNKKVIFYITRKSRWQTKVHNKKQTNKQKETNKKQTKVQARKAVQDTQHLKKNFLHSWNHLAISHGENINSFSWQKTAIPSLA